MSERPRRVYLAGPEVFLADAAAAGARKKRLCEDFGFVGLYPLDGVASASADIFAANMALIRKADLAILNLTPFRGISADVGTVYELGVCIGMRKPVFAYTNVASDLFDRAKAAHSPVFDERARVWRDAAGMALEDFGLADNLMIDEALAAQGRRIHRHAVEGAQRFTDLRGFAACLAEARAAFAALGPAP